MNSRSGLSFADVLILVALVLLLAALAVPKFVKATDYGTEEDEVTAESTDTNATTRPLPAGTTNDVSPGR